MGDQDQRSFIVEAMCRIQGRAAFQFAREWFFNESPDPTAFGFGRHRLAKWLGAAKQSELLKMIFADPRLAELDATTVHWLAHSANKAAAPKAIFSPDEIRDAEDVFERRRVPNRTEKEFKERRNALAMKWRKTVVAKLP